MKEFSNKWIRSTKPGKQRKFRINASLHIKGKFASSPLSKELRKKYNKRSLRIRKNDRVKILRGQFKGKIGAVENVDLKKERVFVAGAETFKKDGSKTFYPLHPSKLMIMEASFDDKKRKKIVDRKKQPEVKK